MKSIQKLLIFIFLPLFFSCTDEFEPELEVETTLDYRINNSQQGNGGSQNNRIYNVPKYSENSLVIQYDTGIHESTKIALRNHYQVLNYEECHCEEKNIERWFFDISVQIEPKTSTIEDDVEEEGEEEGLGIRAVNRDFDFRTRLESFGHAGAGEPVSYASHIKTTNDDITVAVLDTGFDPNYSVFKDAHGNAIDILYNASGSGLEGQTSGWNFIDNTDNTFDDNLGKHGTAISYIFQKILSTYNIPYQILPLKVFDKSGNANYFRMLCAFKHAFEKASIIDASFGWYHDDSIDHATTIFLNLLEDYEDVLVVASAGNTSNDNDEISHYPSSAEKPNMLSIGATNKFNDYLAYFSNYGATSVDFLSKGEGIRFYDAEGGLLEYRLKGTSFAAPQVAAMAAKYLHDSEMSLPPSGLIFSLNVHGTLYPELGIVRYNKVITTPLE